MQGGVIEHGNKAKPNSHEPPAPATVPVGRSGAPARHARVLPLVGHARMRTAPLYGQQPAPVVGGAQRQAFSVQQAAAPTQHSGLQVSQASMFDQAVVGDNFTEDGASSSAARPPVPAPEEVSTELVLALPTPAAAVAAQASFDNWLLSGSGAAAEPQHQQQGAAGVAGRRV